MNGPILMIHMDVKGMDIDALEKQFDEHVKEGMDQLVDRIDETWRNKAAEQLNTTREQYLNGLSVERIGDDLIKAQLEGFLPVALEDGHERYDMKPGFLGSGLKRVIPIGKSAGKPVQYRTMKAGGSGWFHPGFEGKKIGEQVQQEVDERLAFEVFDPLVSRKTI